MPDSAAWYLFPVVSSRLHLWLHERIKTTIKNNNSILYAAASRRICRAYWPSFFAHCTRVPNVPIEDWAVPPIYRTFPDNYSWWLAKGSSHNGNGLWLSESTILYIYIGIYIYMVSCSVFLPPPPPSQWYGSPGSTPCKLLAAFLRSRLVFARSLQHFWLPASHLLGTRYMLPFRRPT